MIIDLFFGTLIVVSISYGIYYNIEQIIKWRK